tara:strand:- start:166 stop:375 length:210 start_codon:yes stop_codon:yes gene_type:complete
LRLNPEEDGPVGLEQSKSGAKESDCTFHSFAKESVKVKPGKPAASSVVELSMKSKSLLVSIESALVVQW